MRIPRSFAAAACLLAGSGILVGPASSAARASDGVPDVALAVDRHPTVTKQGQVTVRGTLTCDAPASVSLWISAQQTRGRATTYSLADEPFGFTSVTCTGRPVAWTHTFGAYAGPLFGPGRATVSAPMVAWEGEVLDSPAHALTTRRTRVELVPSR